MALHIDYRHHDGLFGEDGPLSSLRAAFGLDLNTLVGYKAAV